MPRLGRRSHPKNRSLIVARFPKRGTNVAGQTPNPDPWLPIPALAHRELITQLDHLPAKRWIAMICLWADGIEGLGLEGIRFRLHYGDETLYVKIPLLGRHSVHTALRAAAVGLVDLLLCLGT